MGSKTAQAKTRDDSPHARSMHSIRRRLDDDRALQLGIPLQGLENTLSTEKELDDDILPPGTLTKDTLLQSVTSPVDIESYIQTSNSLSLSRSSSESSISHLSTTYQLSQLTSLPLPDASSLSTSISSIPSATNAAEATSNAAEQMRKWLHKADKILNGFDAEDDVHWAAAGARNGLEEVETAIGKFEGLIHVYVKAIEDLQERPDIADMPKEDLETLVEQMEVILGDWNKVRKHLKGIKSQVELAMEYEELWNVVLGDIGLEVENLGLLIFQMEEKRHAAPRLDSNNENISIDVQELETIVEEANAPAMRDAQANHRFSLPAPFSSDSPLTSPSFAKPQEDSNLLALFARMQPLRASLDFLPMTLANFRSRAEQSLPSACRELEDQRKKLENQWKILESDAELLRRELSEDRWVVVFRNAGRQAEKLCESVERSIVKLQESIDVGSQHGNPAALAKKIESYEAKKMHYGPAIERVLAIIEKGVKDRQTINGEVLLLRSTSRGRWSAVEAQMKKMDVALEDLNMNKNQQLRDSISTIVSLDRSAPGSAADTPGSSPASSVVTGTPNGKADGFEPGINGTSRRNSAITHPHSRHSSSRRVFTAPGRASETQIPRKTPISRSFTSDSWSVSRGASPSPYSMQTSSTPTPGSRPQRPGLAQTNDKPRWNSSPKIDYNDFRPYSKPTSYTTPPAGRKSSLSVRSPPSVMSSYSSMTPLPSPLGRSQTSSPAPRPPSSISHRPRLSSGVQSSLGHRQPSTPGARQDIPRSKLSRQSPNINLTSPSRRESTNPDSSSPLLQSSAGNRERFTAEPAEIGSQEEPSPSKKASKPPRPSTAMGNGRRISMLPQPKTPTLPFSSGRDSSMAIRSGEKERKWK